MYFAKHTQAYNRKILVLLALAVFFIVLVSSPDSSALSLGINPGRVYVEYEPGTTQNVSFYIINSEDVRKEVSLAAMGELKDQVTILNSSLVLNANETREVTFELRIPEGLEPGAHQADVFVRLVPLKGVGGSTLGATVGLIFQAVILNPYPKDYGHIVDVVVSDVKSGETAGFDIKFENLGNSTLKVKGFVDIYSPENTTLAKLETGEEEVNSTKSVTLHASWDTKDAPKGVYRVVTHVEYAGKLTELVQKEFRVGEMLMEITGMPSASVNSGEIGKVALVLKNYWNDKVPDVYALVKITDSSGKVVGNARSESFTVEPWSEKEVTVYWDTSGVGLGTYVSDAVLYYSNKTAERKSEIQVIAKSGQILQPMAGLPVPFGYAGLAVLVVLAGCALLVAKVLLKRRSENKRITVLVEGIEEKIDVLTAELIQGNTHNDRTNGG